MSTFLDSLFAEHVKATDRIFDRDRSRTVGASEIGQCARKIWWYKAGAAKDPEYEDAWGARVRGAVFENHFWVPALRRRYGDKLKCAGVNQRTIAGYHLSATPDAIIVDQPRDALAELGVPDIGPGRSFLAECKTVDPRTNLAQPKPEHVFQLQAQLGLVSTFTAYQPQHGLLTYTDASFWNELKPFVITFDPAIFESAKARARAIMTATCFDELKPEGWIAGGQECAYCPFAKPCGHDRAAVPPKATGEVNTQFAAEIADLARDAKRHEADIDAATVRLREVQHAIKGRFKEHGIRRAQSEDVTVTWSDVKGRQSWDNKAIREAAAQAGVDVESFSTVGEATDRLNIRVDRPEQQTSISKPGEDSHVERSRTPAPESL